MVTDDSSPERIDDVPLDDQPPDAPWETDPRSGRSPPADGFAAIELERREMDVRSRRPGPPPISDRYAALELEQREIVIYDRENTGAWIQSDHAVSRVKPDPEGDVDT